MTREQPFTERVGAGAEAVLVDGHVHLHGCFDERAFFDAAAANLRAGARELGLARLSGGCLMLAETADQHEFRRLREDAGRHLARDWSFRPTAEEESLIALREGEPALALVAGRQIATREGLEVLALGTVGRFPRGLTLADAVEAALGRGALAVIPWGFGKWWGRRGRTVRQLLAGERGARVFLGDNAGRLALAPRPRLFAVAARRRIPILPGSDPLPFPDQVRKPARYGFVLEGALDRERPAAQIRRLLGGRAVQPRTYGRLESARDFVRCQVAMQLRNRGGRASRSARRLGAPGSEAPGGTS